MIDYNKVLDSLLGNKSIDKMKNVKIAKSYDGSKFIKDIKRLRNPNNVSSKNEERWKKHLELSMSAIFLYDEETIHSSTFNLEEYITSNQNAICDNIKNLSFAKKMDKKIIKHWKSFLIFYMVNKNINYEELLCFEDKEYILKFINGQNVNFKKFDYSLSILESKDDGSRISNERIKKAEENLLANRDKVLEQLRKNQNYQDKDISCLRQAFRNAIRKEHLQYFEQLKSWVNEFKYPDAAHIVSVKECIKRKNVEWIKNPKNGLFLDPNTHRLFDKGIIKFRKRNSKIIFWNNEDDKKHSVINSVFCDDERKSFMEKTA